MRLNIEPVGTEMNVQKTLFHSTPCFELSCRGANKCYVQQNNGTPVHIQRASNPLDNSNDHQLFERCTIICEISEDKGTKDADVVH